ncbi:MAG: hypothetical protein ACLUQ0_09265 [Enterococcus italicus]|uniref:hypothetical protein n=1 Tax=Enterococcus italicus TaxID=246144 RepID=UPI003994899E
MIGKVFTPEKWRHAEFFYHTGVMSLLLLAVVCLLFLCIFLLYVKSHKGRSLAIFGGMLLMCGVVYLVGNSYYGAYYTYMPDVQPNIRDRERAFIGYKYYDGATMTAYTHIQNIAGIEKLGIYEAKPVEREIEYLGYAYGSVYFKVGAQQYYLRTTPEFQENATAKLIGVQYHLKASAAGFKQLGFFSETNNFLTNVVLPMSEKSVVYEQKDGKMSKDFTVNQNEWAANK